MRHFSKSIKLLVLTTVIGALAGAAISHFMHPRWLASVTVQIGQISAPQINGVVTRPIENQANAIVRYNLPSFRMGVVNDLGLPAPEDDGPRSRIIFDTMQASAAKSPDLINLQVSAYSREEATAALVSSVKAFSAAHQKMFEPTVSDMKRDLDTASAKLAQAQQDYAHAQDTIRTSTGNSNVAAINTSRDVLVTNMATLINEQVLNLQQQTLLLQQALSPMLTYPTRVVGALYVPNRPNTPSTAALIAAGAVLGLVAGAAFVAARASSQRD